MNLFVWKVNFKNVTKSMKYRLTRTFCFVSVFPVIAVSFISYYNIASVIQSNTKQLSEINLVQTAKNVHSGLATYEDILFQMYTDDDIIKYIDKLNNDEDRAMSINQLRKKLQGVANVKNYIQSITIITEKQDIVFYDKLAPYSIRTSWLDNFGKTPQSLYDSIIKTDNIQYMGTKYASTFSAKPFYLFHLGHRIVDYKSINRRVGIIILSIDERFLNEACNQNTLHNDKDDFTGNVNFIVDTQGNLITFPNQGAITKIKFPSSLTVDNVEEISKDLLVNSGIVVGNNITVQIQYDELLNWNFINISDQGTMMSQVEQQRNLILLVIFLSLFFLITIIFVFTRRMTSSIKNIVKAMEKAGNGNFNVHVKKDKRITTEIATITDQFNKMTNQLNELMRQIKIASIKQKNAEISALEAQINPHFLYNTLDTINWMAIDSDQYEISYAIGALAHILRYGIDKSNSVVVLKKEVEWLKQYLLLQQTRLENTFSCQIIVAPELLNCRIHKLLFQPFVENAILHGFEGVNGQHNLIIEIKEVPENNLQIMVKDNGKGISPEKISEIKAGIISQTEDKNHIGLNNAIERLKMYYGDLGKFSIESIVGKGTTIVIQIPKVTGEEE